MRPLPLLAAALALSTSVAAARPLDVHVIGPRHRVAHARVASYLVRHGLLTREQAACASLVPAGHGSRRVEHLAIFQTTGGRCPGPQQPPVHLFDVYVDRVSGVVDTTQGLDGELDTVM